MKKTFVTAALAGVSILAVCAATNSDPVLMTVNNRPVHKSEFEYLYHKNNAQQLQPQTLDEYVDMFVNYKLKVADAEAHGLDTTASFISEFDKFRFELAEPYLRETAVVDSLVDEAYKHYDHLVYVRHIMLPLGYNGDDMKASENRLDSLRNAIVTGTADWDKVAAQYSVDGGSRDRGGVMGWLSIGRFPWPFEDMAYQTKVGEISPIVNSGYGYHIIRIDSVKPNPGEVHAAHILKLTQGLDSAAQAKAAQQIDSIRALLVAGADFAEMAKKESQDPGSASRGGDLGWFGPGMMVKPFEDASFSIADGEISQPVKTSFGYHLIHRIESRGVPTLEELRPTLVGQINGDDRSLLPIKAKMTRLAKTYNARIEDKDLAKVRKLIGKQYDSVAIEKLSKSKLPVIRIGKTTVAVKDIMPQVAQTASKDVDGAINLIRTTANREMERRLASLERDALIDTNAEYRNLVNEYRDGILLFDRASQMVWDKPTSEPEALEQYFRDNRAKYNWDKPRFKGYVILAKNDSVLNAAKAYTDSIGNAKVSHSDFVKDMRARFGRNIKVERVIAAQGDNVITDYLVFNGPKPESNSNGWNDYYTFQGRIIENPEEAIDVKGAVTTDFQNALEKQWIEQLRATYPVTIDREVLKTVK